MNRYSILNSSSNQDTISPLSIDACVQSLNGEQHPSSWVAKIDTGAKRTAIPLEICDSLRLEPRRYEWVYGYDRSSPPVEQPVYYVAIMLAGFDSTPISVIGVKRQSILLGRDYLKKMVFAMVSSKLRFAMAPYTLPRSFFYSLCSWV